MAAVSVRPARAEDAQSVGEVQLDSWRSAYSDVLPEQVLEQVTGTDLAEHWREAVISPPSARHRVLVALDGADVVGFAAFGPATDDDCDPGLDAEVHTLVVEARAARSGHGSRLLSATVEHLRDDGFRRALVWLLSGDDGLREFLAGAGWAADGATRDLEVAGGIRHQVRLHTDISADPR